MKMDISYYSDVGGREENEDSISLFEDAELAIGAVADGLGGCGDGKSASQHAIQELVRSLSCKKISRDSISEAVQKINHDICSMQINGKQMKTTLAAFCITSEKSYFFHVGDSRIYHFHGNSLIFQSQDHSVSQAAVLMGEIRSDEIRFHKDRNLLVRALGVSDQVKTDIYEANLQKGDSLLICSDGFWEHITEDEMSALLLKSGTADEWLKEMKDRVVQSSGIDGDNNSAMCVMFL